MQLEKTDIQSEWFNHLIDDCQSIIVEAEFTSRWVLVEGYHLLGTRILEEYDNFEREKIYGKEITSHVSLSLGKSVRTIERAIQFAKQYPDLALLPEGKNTSWRKICNEYLPEHNVHVSNNSGENEWYTPPFIIETAKSVMGNIDLDPASSRLANEIVGAKEFYTIEDDGIKKDWHGKVWLNPPYSQPDISNFAKAVTHKKYDEIMILVNNATETDWFRMMADISKVICFINKRVKFIDRDGNPGAPLQGQAIMYKGSNIDGFIKKFKENGLCMIPA